MAALAGMTGQAPPAGADPSVLHSFMTAHFGNIAAAAAGLPVPAPEASRGVPRVAPTAVRNQFAALDSDDDAPAAPHPSSPPPTPSAAPSSSGGRASHTASRAERGHPRGRDRDHSQRGADTGRNTTPSDPSEVPSPTNASEVNLALITQRLQDAGVFIRRSHACRRSQDAEEAVTHALTHLSVALRACGVSLGYTGVVHLPDFMPALPDAAVTAIVRALALEGEARMRGGRIRVDAAEYAVVFTLFYKPALNALHAAIGVFDAQHAEAVADAATAAAPPAMRRVDAHVGECLNFLLAEDARLRDALDAAQAKLEEALLPSMAERDGVKASIGEERWKAGFGRKSDYAAKRDALQAKLREVQRLMQAILDEAAMLASLRERAA